MRYSCEGIRHFLTHDEIDPVDEAGFLSHLENCTDCREAAMLEPELEEILSVSVPRVSPLSFKNDILPEILKLERSSARQNRIEKITLPVIIISSLFPILFVAIFWDNIRLLPGLLNLTAAYDKLVTLISGIDIPAIDLTRIESFISGTPLLTLTLVSITAVIWAFSIMEAQKALKK